MHIIYIIRRWRELINLRYARDAGSSDNGFVCVKSNNNSNNNINYSPRIRKISRYPCDSPSIRAGVYKQSVAENLSYQLRTGKPFRRRILINTEYTKCPPSLLHRHYLMPPFWLRLPKIKSYYIIAWYTIARSARPHKHAQEAAGINSWATHRVRIRCTI